MRKLALLLALVPVAATAHQASVSYSELTVRETSVDGTLRFSLADVRTQTRFDPQHLDAGALRKLLVEPFVVKSAGVRCELSSAISKRPDGDDGIAIGAHWRCPDPVETLSVRAGFLETLPPGHTHFSRIDLGGEVVQRVAQADDPGFEVSRSRSAAREFRRFLRLGVEHIFTGYDHIAFLIGLLLLGGTVRELVKIVTAFTVAHSITLALAALAVFSPSSRVVEPLIAASIVFVGIEDLWALRRSRTESALRHRWMVTFAFGLVHGFGFASVLRQLELPRRLLATGLVSFNLGVECGQLCIVLLALPLLRRLRTWKAFAPAASTCIAALGAIWLLQRLVT
jgi:hydrogenase/urease accessory protein HupE